jgi:hypothetical protein
MHDFGNEKVICILVVGEEAVFIIPTRVSGIMSEICLNEDMQRVVE